RVITHHAEDEKNSPRKTVLLLHVGGLQATTSRGIHWHVDANVRIRYRSDPTGENIFEVELTSPDGKVTTFTKTGAEAAAAGAQKDPPADGAAGGEGWGVMDCVHSHKRPHP